VARVSAIVNGSAQLIDPFATTLETRISLELSSWYQVLDVTVTRSYSAFSFYYDYQATISADTKGLPSDALHVAEKMKLACLQATGFLPNAVAVTSAGQPAPHVPVGSLDPLLGLPEKLAAGLGVTIKTAQFLIIALGVAGVMVLYFVATNPGKAAKIVRG